MKKIIVLAFLIFPILCMAYDFDNGGVRNIAIGETGISSTNDASAAVWNPSLLAKIKRNQVLTDFRHYSLQLDNDDISQNFVYLSVPIKKVGTFGATFGLFDSNAYEESKIGLHYAKGFINDNLLAGLSLNIYKVNYTEIKKDKSAVDVSLGLTYLPLKHLKLGLMIDNVARQKINVNSGKGDSKLPMTIGFGASYQLSRLLVSSDIKYKKTTNEKEILFGLGMEYALYDNLALRFGMNNNYWTTGFGVNLWTKNWFTSQGKSEDKLYDVNGVSISVDYALSLPISFESGDGDFEIGNDTESKYGEHFFGIVIEFGADKITENQLPEFFPNKYGPKFYSQDTSFVEKVRIDTIIKERVIVDTVEIYEKMIDHDLMQQRLEEQLEIIKVKEYDSVNRASIEHLVNALRFFYDGQFKKAISECERCIDIAPKLSLPYVILGSIYYKLGENEYAFDYWEKAKRVYSKNAELNKILENIYNGVEDFIPKY